MKQMFILSAEHPYEFDDGGESHTTQWSKPMRYVVEANSAQEAVDLLNPQLPEIEETAKRILDEERPEYVGKKGYNISVYPAKLLTEGIWNINADSVEKEYYKI